MEEVEPGVRTDDLFVPGLPGCRSQATSEVVPVEASSGIMIESLAHPFAHDWVTVV